MFLTFVSRSTINEQIKSSGVHVRANTHESVIRDLTRLAFRTTEITRESVRSRSTVG